MGRAKHCSVEERRMIFNLTESGNTPAKIAEIMKCSRKMVYNALKVVKENTAYLTNQKKRKPKPRKTDPRTDMLIVRKSKADPFKSSREIMEEINEECGTNVSRKLVARRLIEASLFGRISRKKPLLSKRNISQRLSFARAHRDKDLSFWKNILWSDETKINKIGPDGKTFVRRPKGQALNPRYTMKTVKHGAGSIMCWGAFSWRGVGPLYRINGVMDRFMYVDILKNQMEPFTFENMPLKWTFQHDNDPKHTSCVVKKWLKDESIQVLEWPAQSPDLNPIENLWNDVKVMISRKKFSNLDDLWKGVQEAWNSIPKERCQKLVESMGRRCNAVIENHGYSTKY